MKIFIISFIIIISFVATFENSKASIKVIPMVHHFTAQSIEDLWKTYESYIKECEEKFSSNCSDLKKHLNLKIKSQKNIYDFISNNKNSSTIYFYEGLIQKEVYGGCNLSSLNDKCFIFNDGIELIKKPISIINYLKFKKIQTSKERMLESFVNTCKLKGIRNSSKCFSVMFDNCSKRKSEVLCSEYFDFMKSVASEIYIHVKEKIKEGNNTIVIISGIEHFRSICSEVESIKNVDVSCATELYKSLR